MAIVTRPASTRPPAHLRIWLDRILSSFLLRRLVKMILIIWIVVTITFLVIRALPGNPVDIFVANLMDTGLSEREARTRAGSLLRLDLDRPLAEQYIQFMGNLVQGELGESYVSGKSVREIVLQRLPWTLFSVGTALLISCAIGMFLGIAAAYRRNSWLDHLLTNMSAALDAIPPLLIATLLFLLLGVVWRIVPVSTMQGSLSPGVRPGFTLAFFADLLKHWAVPGLVYIVSTLGGWILAMRSSTISALEEDYVAVARARGLSDRRIISAYVGRNASLPLVNGVAIALGFVVSGSILIERIFVYQGIGMLLGQAIEKRDYPVMQGVFLVTTIAVLIATNVADLLSGWLDPRIRVTDKEQ
jgi:peptide/nickel transport system permease protein